MEAIEQKSESQGGVNDLSFSRFAPRVHYANSFVTAAVLMHLGSSPVIFEAASLAIGLYFASKAYGPMAKAESQVLLTDIEEIGRGE